MTDTLKYDYPLNDPAHDILGRKNFSEMLAQSIIKLKASQGFVYGLYGPWGSGKSTVINFTEHYIEEHNKEAKAEGKVVIFKFNPWMFSGSENLTKVYLDQLQIRLGMEDVSENLKGLSKKFEVIERSLAFASPIINLALPGVGSSIVNSVNQSLSSAREISNSSSELMKKDLFHIKEEITKTLQSQNDKILVIIDDLDRLFDDEIRDFVKMIGIANLV
jgi:predicted KAP-like P-loop ATPase